MGIIHTPEFLTYTNIYHYDNKQYYDYNELEISAENNNTETPVNNIPDECVNAIDIQDEYCNNILTTIHTQDKTYFNTILNAYKSFSVFY